MNIQEALNRCVEKTEQNIRQIGTVLYEYPGRLCTDGKYFETAQALRPLQHIFCWTQGFFTGMAGISYQLSGQKELLQWLYSLYPQFYDKVFQFGTETMHDLGFLYSPYAVMLYRITGDRKMRELGVKAAELLADRYVANGGYIRAWGRMDGWVPAYVDAELAKDHFFTQSNGVAIIDCMMNLPLLFWAGEVTGEPRYCQTAQAHIETTLRHFIREDGSVCHAYLFDTETGLPICVQNFCGYSDDSYWARGTAWAMYGFAVAYRYTGEQRYLDTAKRLTAEYLRCAGDRGVPVWDFRLPADRPALPSGKIQADWDITDAKNKDKVVDTSAAAVAVCALQELSAAGEVGLRQYGVTILQALADHYFDSSLETNGLLHHSNGQMGYTAFGDYFFMEALARETRGISVCW